jgi:hypothetical protein
MKTYIVILETGLPQTSLDAVLFEKAIHLRKKPDILDNISTGLDYF